jgi:DHA1 family multidrug resistance protein-like MFS transporter
MYNFNLREGSLPFLSILVALFIALPLYLLYFYLTVKRPFAVSGFGAPERRPIPGLFDTYLIPVSLFIFA